MSLEFHDLPEHIRRHLVEEGDCWVPEDGRRPYDCYVRVGDKIWNIKALVWMARGNQYRKGQLLCQRCGNDMCVRHTVGGAVRRYATPAERHGPERPVRVVVEAGKLVELAVRRLALDGYRRVRWTEKGLKPEQWRGRVRGESVELEWRSA